MGAQRWPVIATTSIYIKDLRDVVFSSQSGSIDSANDIKLRKELELLLSQRRIRSIYQANTEIHNAIQREEPSPPGNSELPLLDVIWQDFMDFDFEETNSLNFLEPTWLAQEQPHLFTSSAEAANDIQAPKLPKDIIDVIDSLPACSFCRDQHIRCDRELPCCGACSRSHRDCAFFDHLWSQEIPRGSVVPI